MMHILKRVSPVRILSGHEPDGPGPITSGVFDIRVTAARCVVVRT